MGGGDLNMKKSWHPLLRTNQERVWKQEKAALDEKKRIAQLQKELAEERQLQELQRLQAEQSGVKREEKVEWLYATPATGGGPNAEELEAYLLGKKRVDKLFREKDEEAAKLAAQASKDAQNKPGGGFISLQNANTARDTAAKIREDPLLAIKQQEQAAYEALLKNPARLKAMQGVRGGANSKDEDRKREKRERKARKEEKRRHGRQGSPDPDDHEDRRSSKRRRASPLRDDRDRGRSRLHDSRSPPRSRKERADRRSPSYEPRPSRSVDDRIGGARGSRGVERHDRQSRRSDHREYDRRSRSRSPNHREGYHSRPAASATDGSSRGAPRRPEGNSLSTDKAARLAAMAASASSLAAERKERVDRIEAEDAAALAREEADRKADSKGKGRGGPAFMRSQEKAVYGGMSLAERVQRSGGVGLMRERE